MTLYELVNPSDPYTFYASTHQVAAAAGLAIGAGQYGVRTGGADDVVLPVLFFCSSEDTDKWLKETFGSLTDFAAEHRQEIADALDSFVCGPVDKRPAYDKAIDNLEPAEVGRHKVERHNKRRSSMNDIGKSAWAMAKELREK